jgi:hypothetical protein
MLREWVAWIEETSRQVLVKKLKGKRWQGNGG